LGCLPAPWLIANDNAPSHPLGGELLSGDPLVLIAAYLVACVGAPLIEETVFRGVLFRHLRESSRAAPRWLSAIFAAGLNALVFAIIHPQGLLVVPALAALGFNFSLVREWRDSLIGPMTMHALHNGTLITAFILVFTW
jgi:membrane protease YdiL (CAAX protease family)